MTRLVAGGRERADTWEHLTRDAAPTGGDFTVDVARWLDQRDELLAHVARTGRSLGVRLAIDTDPAILLDDIRYFALIVVEIPNAADGRFFSIAARLREQLHYRGELRATGDVAPDQLSFMQRCGIDAFELGDGVDIERFMRRYERFYQPSGAMAVNGATDDDSIRLARRRVGRSRARPSFGETGSGNKAVTG